MEIVPIHYNLSRPVREYEEIRQAVLDMDFFMNHEEINRGLYNHAHALAHSEVCNMPYAFFMFSNEMFPNVQPMHRVIINPKILNARLYVHAEPNAQNTEEPCLSFPFRKAKKLIRYNKIKVSYQIPGTSFFGKPCLKTVKQNLSGASAAIFQHCFDHTQARNIFFQDNDGICWWE